MSLSAAKPKEARIGSANVAGRLGEVDGRLVDQAPLGKDASTSARLAPRGNGPLRAGENAHSSSVAPGAATAAHRPPLGKALGVAELVVKAAEIEQELKA